MDGNSGLDLLRDAPAGQWLYDGSLDEVTEINRQALDLLVAMAANPLYSSPFFEGQSAAWRDVPPSARAQLATSPCLVADAHFDSAARWRDALHWSDPSALETRVFKGSGAEDFIRRVLVFGWHLARADRKLARMVLGMTGSCADQLVQLRLRDIDWIAQHRPGWVRPRWEGQPRLWRNLLLSAKRDCSDELLQFRARGLQLMAGASLLAQPAPVRPGPRSSRPRVRDPFRAPA